MKSPWAGKKTADCWWWTKGKQLGCFLVCFQVCAVESLCCKMLPCIPSLLFNLPGYDCIWYPKALLKITKCITALLTEIHTVLLETAQVASSRWENTFQNIMIQLLGLKDFCQFKSKQQLFYCRRHLVLDQQILNHQITLNIFYYNIFPLEK